MHMETVTREVLERYFGYVDALASLASEGITDGDIADEIQNAIYLMRQRWGV